MAFSGPAPIDYRNVVALNQAYLGLLQSSPDTRSSLDKLSPALCRRLISLTPYQADRLATTPFLLLSFRERDDRLWDQVLADEGDGALPMRPAASGLDRLLSAGLGFVWQLARQNPYTLRLTCGASLHWCERIAERTFFGLLAAVASYRDLIELRRADDDNLWQKLLVDGISRDHDVRIAAHMSALQTVLTRPAGDASRRWPLAACRTRRPGLQVADE